MTKTRTQITREGAAQRRRERIEASGGRLVQIALDADGARQLDALAELHLDRRGKPSQSAAVAWLLAQWAARMSRPVD